MIYAIDRKIKLPEIDPKRVEIEIGNFIVKSIDNAHQTGAIIGLSGGVDSTVTAALAQRAFERSNKCGTSYELVGYILPSQLNSCKDTDDGVNVAKALGIRYQVISIEPVIEAHIYTNPEALASEFDRGNLIARVRANVLSSKAATEKKMLLGTGNKDEDFGVGYYTMFGDGAVHLSPIGALSKRLVFQMAHYFGFPDIAKKAPSAGLELGQTDFKDLGYGYDAVEIVLEGITQGLDYLKMPSMEQVREIIEPQLKLSEKFSTVDDVVNDIVRRHYQVALPKATIIHPPIATVSLEYR